MIIERDVMLPMRDGVGLSTNIFRPDSGERLPALVHRTPYGKGTGGFEAFVNAGYVVLSQDLRGRYGSEGEFTVFTEENTGDAEDGYDTVEWAAAQPWCDGNVGTFGTSYDAWVQYELARLRPPHLRAMSALSIPPENSAIDWPGVFRPGRRIRWWLATIAPDMRRRQGLPPPHTSEEAVVAWGDGTRAMRILPWSKIADELPSPLAEQVLDWMRRPGRPVWNHNQAHANIEIPNLDVTGWFDHCGNTDHFTGMQSNAGSETARRHSKVIIGPWNHANLGPRKQAGFDFGPAAAIDVRKEQIRWFNYWLKGADNGVDRDPPVRYFVMGSGEWESATTWPPAQTNARTLFLGSNGDAHDPRGSGSLSPERRGDDPPDAYTNDPHDPVPTLWDPAHFYNVSDRRQLDERSDVLRYRTEPIDDDLTVAGNPEVVLHASTTAPDTDLFARLIDEDPDGPAMEICYGMVRARHRNGLESEELITPGEIIECRIQLGMTACCFRMGHRIRLEICGHDFPNFDRNHQLGRNDLFDAELAVAEQAIHHAGACPSSLTLPVVEK